MQVTTLQNELLIEQPFMGGTLYTLIIDDVAKEGLTRFLYTSKRI